MVKGVAVTSDSRLAEKHRPAVLQLDGDCDGGHQRRKHDKSDDREGHVSGALANAAPAGEVRLLNVQERKADLWADVHPRPCHLHQTRIDEHLNAGTLQRPG